MPQLTFTAPRYPAADLPLSEQQIRQQKTIAEEKAASVIRYVRQIHYCRAQIILEYLSEVAYPNCGQCDVCLEKENVNYTEAAYQEQKRKILQYVRAGKNKVNTIVDALDLTLQEPILSVIRQMLDSGELVYDTDGRLEIV